MSRAAPPDHVPILTEVLEAAPDPDAVRRLTAEVQLHVDREFDARMRAALEPLLQQLIVRVAEETRRELASTLRDGITRALAQETSRHRGGSLPR